VPVPLVSGARESRSERPAVLAVSEPDRAVRCVACAHRCLVRPGRTGICGVRANRDGTLVTLVYGHAVSASADPVEKKPLFHVYPGSIAWSIATEGCNFHCLHCQNWTISQAPRERIPIRSAWLPPAAVVSEALGVRARTIAYTYTEPTVYIEYVLDTARRAADAGLANVLVTNGYETPEALDLLGPLVAAANVDLKSFDDGFYRRVCGARLAGVLEAIVGMRERGLWLELTTLVIPGLNDDPAMLESLAGWIVSELGPGTPWHVSRFFPAYRLADVPSTPIETMNRAVAIGRAAGLHYVYSGNMSDGDQDTRCAGCGATLIRRQGFSAVRAGLAGGRCGGCGRELEGVGLAEFDSEVRL
jgi:pyruvate formate lyase activating enzyme